MSARQTNSPHHNMNSNHNPLSKLYRLYSPQNKFRPCQKYPKKLKTQQPPIIELIFNHPHLLFMQTDKNTNPIQKNAMAEFNIVKNIVDRKKQRNMSKKPYDKNQKPYETNIKPMTAPNIQRKRYNKINLSTEPQQSEKKNQINVFDFNDFAENSIKNDDFSSQIPSYRLKPKTSCSKGRRPSRQNVQLQEKVSLNRNPSSRNTFDSYLYQKKKTINMKYEQDRILRQKMYQSNNPTTQIYVNMEAKFAKYVKKNL